LFTGLRARVRTEDEEPLVATIIERHEHEDTGLLLNAAKLAASISCDPSFAICRNEHLCAVIAM